ncbi:hypothetical protein [Bradyrhizobium glycinis]|uniref:hypothetical protein n=1 Tax=Bradyrhizobium glycinis TaxID=2751812 RepID=UPI0018D9505E|nr:hypothetical protein [Bradyrhizobium glycinis]MBH5370585.1 hypothetical protein [Bradyrhizobium glycinis]
MKDHGDICHGAGQIAGSAGQFRTAENTNCRRLELIQMESSRAEEWFPSATPRFNSATAQKIAAAADAIETTHHLHNAALNLSARRPSDLVPSA